MKKSIYLIVFLMGLFASCDNYLDVVPDNVATIDNAFTDEVQARKYLFTCYSYLPNVSGVGWVPGWYTGDEFWPNSEVYNWLQNPSNIARNAQNANEPLLNFYEGRGGGSDLFQGIRVCNTFISRVDNVPGLDNVEKIKWKAEAKFLKAYYHYYLTKMYGPIPLITENIDVSATPDEVRLPRASFDECINFIVDLLDEAAEGLPTTILNELDELGRITKSIALAVKADVLLTAASPLFNGNPDYSTFNNIDGTPFFGPYDKEKWKRAADAGLEAIEEAEAAGAVLYEFSDLVVTNPSAETVRKLTLRGRVTDPWNKEIVWGSSQNDDRQYDSQANFVTAGETVTGQWMAPTYRIVEQYYTNHGVPIEEDIAWADRDPLAFRTAQASHSLDIQEGAEIPQIHFDREPRFYADLGFDRGTWYGQGKLDENDQHIVKAKRGETSGKKTISKFSITGYFPKKLVNYENAFGTSNSYSSKRYSFPYIRLAELYLNYAEALNEYSGPSAEVYSYIDKIRERAGLEGVVQSWGNYTNNPGKPTNVDGLRDIIQKERLIELSFENHRYWDLRRWKLLQDHMNGPIQGWNIDSDQNDGYYNLITFFNQKFTMRNYLWPIRSEVLLLNPNLVQNPGW
tara:strand:- start:39192 stop:41072 length:1881 start_codon:yes stop_codon:yes gene_type:complete